MRKRTFVMFFAAALLFRLAIAAKFGFYEKLGRSEVEVLAQNIVQGGEYTLYGVPSAYNTPVFPLFLAANFAIFGNGVVEKTVAVILNCAVSGLVVALVPFFAVDAGLEPVIGLLAGWIGVFFVGSVETETGGNVEGSYVGLALLVLLWAAMRLWRSGSWRARSPWWFFAFCGFAILLSPTMLPVIAAILIGGAIACPAALRRRYLLQSALAVAGIAVFLVPWALRNNYMLGSPILTRSNFGIEFWVSNGGPDRTFDHAYNYETYHPSRNGAEAARVVELGEVEYGRIKRAEAMDFIRANPGSFVRLIARRFGAWWFPPYPLLLVAPKFVLTLAAFTGLWLLFRRNRLVAWLILLTWLTFPDVYYVVHWVSRYRTPMDWQLVLCCSVALFESYRVLTRSRRVTARDVPAAA